MTARPSTDHEVPATPYRAALEAAMRELEKHRRATGQLRQDLAWTEKRIRELLVLIESLRALVPNNEVAQIAPQIAAAPKLDAGRGSPVYNNVVKLLACGGKREWSAEEIRRELGKDDRNVDQKAIYNALTYLAKKGGLVRVGRGLYRITGYNLTLPLSDDEYIAMRDEG